MEQAQGVKACLECPLAICLDNDASPAGVEPPEHCPSDRKEKTVAKRTAYDMETSSPHPYQRAGPLETHGGS